MHARNIVLLVLLSLAFTASAADRAIRIEVAAPPLGADDPLYITGNRPDLGNWNPGAVRMQRAGDQYTHTITVPDNFILEFKFTRGAWQREALQPDGSVPQNHEHTVKGDATLSFRIEKFKDEKVLPPLPPGPPTAEGSDVLGTLQYLHDVESKHLQYKRHVAVWLPPGYDAAADRRYPVLYMHDGQNLFDPRMANTGIDWGVDEAVVRLVEAKKIPPIIVIGVFNSRARGSEYNPDARGEDYARFLIEELKPMIDSKYRTRPEAKYTGTSGSSAGGLISVYLGVERSDTFTRIGALSAHISGIPFRRDDSPSPFVARVRKHGPPDKSVRMYIDSSTQGPDAFYEPAHKEFKELFEQWGWRDGENLMVKRFENTRHTEADWRKRMDIPLEFMFGDLMGEGIQ